jgi:hypothetical protein
MKLKTILIAYQDDHWARSLSTFLHGIGYRVGTAKVVSDMIRRFEKKASMSSFSVMRLKV